MCPGIMLDAVGIVLSKIGDIPSLQGGYSPVERQSNNCGRWPVSGI